MYGQSRVFFAMARDGLLPERLSAVHARFGTPVLMTLVTGVFVAIIAGFLPLTQIVELANAGTLIAFIAVACCMVVMRSRAPEQARTFRVPLAPLIAIIAVLGCAYLFWSLPTVTKTRFCLWNVIGIGVYLLWARRNSLLERNHD
jgi:APA family basic amino acid/polyamine antiporter